MKIRTLLASAVVASSMLAATSAGAGVLDFLWHEPLQVGDIELSPPAGAEMLDFSWVGTGTDSGDSASWTQPSNPTPVSTTAFSTFIDVTNAASTNGSFSVVEFYTSGSIFNGGFAADADPAIFDFGAQLFTGTEATPMFSAGVTALDSGNLTVTVLTGAAIPELSTWAMMLMGFAGVGFVGYRRTVKTRLIWRLLEI